MKMVEKRREGSKVKKKYDQARTPYERVLASGQVESRRKGQLRKHYEGLNPAHLKREITRLQNELIEMGKKKDKRKEGEKNGVCVKSRGGKK
jgi:hypothetical protein